jgi:nucleoside-diphosphate-sugar epimerase
LFFGIVDVRDVADLHVRAMTHPAAAGERFIAAADDLLSVLDWRLRLPEEAIVATARSLLAFGVMRRDVAFLALRSLAIGEYQIERRPRLQILK